MTLFYGKYRGQVQDNLDPYVSGRVQVTAPAVLGDAVVWAFPCVPFAAKGIGFFAIPPVGANVWVEFEGGNPEVAIWSGCFWDKGDAPAPMPDMKVFKTDSATITLNDLPGVGGLTIETSAGMKITLSATSIQIDNGAGGNVTLEGPKVSINQTALEVT